VSLQLGAVKRLLGEAKLPAADLTEAHLRHFLVHGTEEAPDAVVGLELYPPVALLRSLAVTAGSRRHGVGSSLLADAERYARSQRVNEIYLLTDTAERFFARAGYERVARESAPAAIRGTEEFSTVCPASAALMRKRL
jgi:amino-acid N-acetyltransferase